MSDAVRQEEFIGIKIAILKMDCADRDANMQSDLTTGNKALTITADLWRIAQQSRSECLVFWLRNLFLKRQNQAFKKPIHASLPAVVVGLPPRKPKIADDLTQYQTPRVYKSSAG